MAQSESNRYNKPMKKIDLSRSLLLIIDVQNDFCPGGSLAVEGGHEIIESINALSPLFPFTTATRDWHPEGHVSFASSHAGRSVYDTVEAGGIEQVLWPDHCVAGTEGAELHPSLDLRSLNMIVHKGTKKGLDSYSAFFDNDHRFSTGLEGYLKALNIETVYLCGLALDYCVQFSALDCINLGFDTVVIEDATRAVDVPEGNRERSLSHMKNAGIRLIQSSELLN